MKVGFLDKKGCERGSNEENVLVITGLTHSTNPVLFWPLDVSASRHHQFFVLTNLEHYRCGDRFHVFHSCVTFNRNRVTIVASIFYIAGSRYTVSVSAAAANDDRIYANDAMGGG